MGKAKTGRPTSLDEVTQRRLLKSITNGNRLRDAAAAAGIAWSTLKAWFARGRDGDEPYRTFLALAQAAKLEAKERLVTAVVKGGLEDPRVGIEILARRYPKQWARRQRIDVAGVEGAPLNVRVVDADEARVALAEKLGGSSGK